MTVYAASGRCACCLAKIMTGWYCHSCSTSATCSHGIRLACGCGRVETCRECAPSKSVARRLVTQRRMA